MTVIGLGAVDHQRAARGQPHLAIQRLEQLLVDPVLLEDVVLADVAVQPGRELGGHVPDVVGHGLPRVVAGDDEPGEVFVELVPHNLDQHVRLLVEEHRCLGPVGAGLLRLLLDDLPLRLQPADVTLESLLRHTFRGGADDDARLTRNDLAQQVLQPLALDVRQLATDPRRAARGDVDQETARRG
jgi:hypothetical protein